MKDIIKVIGPLENKSIALKRTARKTNSQEGGLSNFLGTLVRTDLPLMKRVLTPLAKSVLVPLGLTAAASAVDAAIQKNIYGWGMTALIISVEEMNDIKKIITFLEESGLLIKISVKKMKMKQK